MSALAVADVDEVREAVREGGPLLPVAGGTHPATLPAADGGVRALDVSGLTGVVDYDPAELTFTARSGTTLAEIDAMLAAQGQRLPFAPPRLGEGATIGGAVAAGITGPTGFAAGVRDFVVGVRFVDGTGRLAMGGGRVVKNAAGFDLPKLMVGSLGRLGVIVELSLKVFPRPDATASVRFRTGGLPAGLAAVAALARGPIPPTALDLAPDGAVTSRIGGSAELIDARTARLAGALEPAGEPLEDEAAHCEEALRFGWVEGGARLVVVPVAPRQVVALDADLDRHGAERRYGLGANVAWVAWPEAAPLDALAAILVGHRLGGLVVGGQPLAQPLLGFPTGGAFAARVARGLDPDGVFGGPR
ncbi:MAG TPA: FAD-binding protein [Solirubrobacterales bacterium]|jgi:glycolate oxidase FAD binding subunit|nr:FAD-binding protein [Solirubrobacterales bacterium]